MTLVLRCAGCGHIISGAAAIRWQWISDPIRVVITAFIF